MSSSFPVIQVLRFGYIMIRIDGYETDETGSDWFCYHASSPLIFPPGFSEKNRIKLKPPAGWEDCFKWVDYFKETRSTPASVSLFHPRDEVKHGFKVSYVLIQIGCAQTVRQSHHPIITLSVCLC